MKLLTLVVICLALFCLLVEVESRKKGRGRKWRDREPEPYVVDDEIKDDDFIDDDSAWGDDSYEPFEESFEDPLNTSGFDDEFYMNGDDDYYGVDDMGDEDYSFKDDPEYDYDMDLEDYGLEDTPTSSLGRDDDYSIIDDNFVSQDEIPKDYFPNDYKPTNSIPKPSNFINKPSMFDIEIPGFQIKICQSQWWKARKNVCISKEVKPSETKKTPFTYTMFKCYGNSVDTYTCNVSQSTNNGSVNYLLTYKCCNGFTRKAGDWGCPRIKLSDPDKRLNFTQVLMKNFNYSTNSSNDFYLSSPMNNSTTKLWSVFVPVHQKFEKWTRSILDVLDAKVIINLAIDQELKNMIQTSKETLANHFIANKSVPASSLQHGTKLKTSAEKSVILVKKIYKKTLVNCVPVLKTDIAFNNYSIAHLVERVIPLAEKNMYELVSEKLSHLSSSVAIQKIMSEMKAQLTASTPFTLFLYIPRNETEINTNCFTRFLKHGLVPQIICSSCLREMFFVTNDQGQKLAVKFNKTGTTYLQGVKINETDLLATNGVLHIIEQPILSVETENELYAKVKSMSKFKELAKTAHENNRTFVMVLPPYKEGFNYSGFTENKTDTELEALASRMVSVQNYDNYLHMVSGEKRKVTKVTVRPQYGMGNIPETTEYVDCVKVKKSVKTCDGCLLYFMEGPLPDFSNGQSLFEHLNSRFLNFSTTFQILNYINTTNHLNISARWNSTEKMSFVMLQNYDLNKLLGISENMEYDKLVKIWKITKNMDKIATWYIENLIKTLDMCAIQKGVKQPIILREFVSTPIKSCSGLFCFFSHVKITNRKVVVVLDWQPVKVRQGFILDGKVLYTQN